MDLSTKASILVVDSSAESLVLIKQLLQESYDVTLARNGTEALRVAHQRSAPHLILLATALPDTDGFAVLRELRCNFFSAEIPVIMLVGDGDSARRALAEGATDTLAMPPEPEPLQARVRLHVELLRARGLLRDQHSHFEHLVAERMRAVVQMQDATIVAMAGLAESRDPDIGGHIRRTQHYVAALARELRFKARFTAELTDENIALLFKAAPLHDIGKVGVPDTILFAPGRLSDDDMALMKKHTEYGRDAIAGVEATLGGSTQFLRYAREITYSHHERWDGSGYPQGLVGEAIPLSARLMAVADVYDALISARTYRPAFTHETAIELIRQGSGQHFEEDIVDALLAIEEKFTIIAAQFPAPAGALPVSGG